MSAPREATKKERHDFFGHACASLKLLLTNVLEAGPQYKCMWRFLRLDVQLHPLGQSASTCALAKFMSSSLVASVDLVTHVGWGLRLECVSQIRISTYF